MGKILDILKMLLESASLVGVIVGFIPDDFINKYPLLAGIINNYIVKILIFLIIFLLYIYSSIKENTIDLQYRLGIKPDQIHIRLQDLKKSSFDKINLSFKKSDENYSWINRLSSLRFNLFISFEWPQGIKLYSERIGSEFKVVNQKPNKLILRGDLPLSGRRSIEIDIAPEIESTFDGESCVLIKIYIAPDMKYLNSILAFEFNKSKIEIL